VWVSLSHQRAPVVTEAKAATSRWALASQGPQRVHVAPRCSRSVPRGVLPGAALGRGCARSSLMEARNSSFTMLSKVPVPPCPRPLSNHEPSQDRGV
jgi:hypothetical protein